MALMEVQGLSVSGRLQAVDLQVDSRQLVGVIGPNGSGKSSLLEALAGTLPARGRIAFEGRPLTAMRADERARRIALQPQFVEVVWSLRVRDVVALGRLPWGDEDEAIIEDALQSAGIHHLAERPVDRLSGGEQARVWLARVLANRPLLWLADEPVASLDFKYQRLVMERLRRFADEDGAVLLAIHDLSLAARYCDGLCLLDAGRVVARGRVEEVLREDLLSRVYGLPISVDLSANPPRVFSR